VSAKEYKDNLHKGARPSTFKNACNLRHRETEAEKKLWKFLRNRQLLGKKFRRQHAIIKYVLDFYCHECKLAVELDGGIHTKEEIREYDLARTGILKEYGITVIRFWNAEVMNDIEDVLKKISDHLT
jgi:very-short-patch-repair endonuclease